MGTKANMDMASLLIMLAAASAGNAGNGRVVEAELREDVAGAFVNPEAASSLPRVLIIGDSISIGYTEPVRENLKDSAEVFRPPVNCQHTGYGLSQIKTWLGTGKWDVIHFNFGIWDTHMLDAKGNLLSGSREGDTAPATDGIGIRHTPEQYKDNLNRILDILESSGASLIWASSTPIMYRKGRRFEDIPKLNSVAENVMKARGVAVNDLYAFVLPHVGEWQAPDQCHFNAAGNEQLGKQVADCIRRALGGKKR